MTEAQVEQIEKAGPIRRFIVLWFAAFGGVAAWTVHLVYLASAVKWTHNDPFWGWTMHVISGVTMAATIAAMALCWGLVRATRSADPEDSSDAGQLHFLGQLGLLVGAINLALITVEEIYTYFLPRVAR